jgi:hypothetical protein
VRRRRQQQQSWQQWSRKKKRVTRGVMKGRKGRGHMTVSTAAWVVQYSTGQYVERSVL